MGKGQKKVKKRRVFAKYTAVVAVALLVILAVGTAARYLRTDKSDSGQATAKAFYFTTDLLGDSYMVDESGSTGGGSTYSFPDVQSGTFYLYGGTLHQITIEVQNFSDDTRITTEDITYTASVTADTNDVLSNVSLTKDGSPWTGGTLAQSDEPVSDTLVLNIPEYSQDNPYADGTKVTVQLESTLPYRKTIELEFVLYSADAALWYQVNDSAGSPYAELIIMTGEMNGKDTPEEVQPYLRWSKDLSIDNTNSLTYTYNKDAEFAESLFIQQGNMTDRTDMQISRSLNPGESESIYFFKSDTSKNYSKSAQVVAPEEGNRYTITIGEETTTTETGK